MTVCGCMDKIKHTLPAAIALISRKPFHRQRITADPSSATASAMSHPLGTDRIELSQGAGPFCGVEVVIERVGESAVAAGFGDFVPQ